MYLSKSQRITFKHKGISLYGFCYKILVLEFLNSVLRSYEIINMSFSIVIRMIFVVLLFFIAIIKFFTNHRIKGNLAISLLMLYVYMLCSFLLNGSVVDATNLSNLLLPLITAIIGLYTDAYGDKRRITNFSVVMLFILSVLYLYYVVHGPLRSITGGTNSIFYIIVLFPCCLSINNKILRNIITAFVTIVVILSLKTTAFLIVACMILFLYYSNVKGRSWKMIVLPIVLFGVVVGLYYFSLNYLNINLLGTFVSSNLEKRGGGSERLNIWRNLFEHYKSSGIIQKLFGNGLYASTETNVLGRTAHNDFLEVLYDFGMVGLVLFIVYILNLIKTFFRIRRVNYKDSIFLGMFLIAMIIPFLFSNCLFQGSYLILMQLIVFNIYKESVQGTHNDVPGSLNPDNRIIGIHENIGM